MKLMPSMTYPLVLVILPGDDAIFVDMRPLGYAVIRDDDPIVRLDLTHIRFHR